MRGWRTKFIFLLIVYFSGFATAVYCLAPAPDDTSDSSLVGSKDQILSKFKSEQFAKSINSGMHKCIDFGKEAASQTSEYIKQKIEEKQNQTDD